MKRADKDLLKTVEKVSAGDIYIAAKEALWLFAGVMLNTAASEIAGLMG